MERERSLTYIYIEDFIFLLKISKSCLCYFQYSHQVLPMLVPKVPFVEPPSTCSKTSSQPLTTPSPKSHSCQSPTPSEDFDFKEKLDSEGKYVLFWNNNKTHITFEIHVETKGYIGFGLSPNGKMYPADVIVGWVKDGVPHFKVSIDE